MRKLIYILIGLFALGSYAQGGPKVDVIKFRGEVTTTVRNTFDVPTGETWLIWNETEDKLEVSESDDVWKTVVTSGTNNMSDGITLRQSALNSIEIMPDGAVGGTDFIRMKGGETPNEVYLYLTSNYATIENYSIADIEAVGDASLTTKEYVDSVSGGGDVTAASTFDDDNRLIRSDGTGKGVQKSNLVFNDSNQFYPAVDNSYLLGTPTNRWSAINANKYDVNQYITFNPSDTEPPSIEGSFYADESENRLKYYDGTSFKKVLLDGDASGTDDQTAAEVSYDNTDSSLSADDVKEAIDELDSEKGALASANVWTGISNSFQKPITIGGASSANPGLLKLIGESVDNLSGTVLYDNDGVTEIGMFGYTSAEAGIFIANSTSSKGLFLRDSGIAEYEGQMTVSDDAYDATDWNGNLEVPTKNAIRDKIETIVGGGTDDQTAAEVPVTASGFDGNLDTGDDTVQKVAQKLDDLVVSSGGIVAEGVLTTSGGVSVHTISHGLGYAPANTRIQLQALYTAGSSVELEVQNITSTTFDIDLDVTVNGYIVAWRIFGVGSETPLDFGEIATGLDTELGSDDWQTNALTDAQLETLGYITATENINLDNTTVAIEARELLTNKVGDLSAPSDNSYLTTNGIVDALDESNLLGIETATTSRSAVLTDADGILQITNASAMTYTIPTNAAVAYPIGTVISIKQMDDGPVTLAYSGGVTGEAGGTYAKNDRIIIQKTGTDTWVVLQHPTFREMTQTAYDAITPIDGILYVIVD